MALEDLASMRAIHSSTVLIHATPTRPRKLTRIMADTPGIVFMRTTRGAYPTLYGANEVFKVGGSKVLRQRPQGQGGADRRWRHVHNCLAAADALVAKKIPARGDRPVLGQTR